MEIVKKYIDRDSASIVANALAGDREYWKERYSETIEIIKNGGKVIKRNFIQEMLNAQKITRIMVYYFKMTPENAVPVHSLNAWVFETTFRGLDIFISFQKKQAKMRISSQTLNEIFCLSIMKNDGFTYFVGELLHKYRKLKELPYVIDRENRIIEFNLQKFFK